MPAPGMAFTTETIVDLGLNTVCESAKCPNRTECWSHRTATFMIGGGVDRWNNIAMVEAVSRIFTGRRVDLHLLLSIGNDTLATETDSLPQMTDVRTPVLDGMRAVVREPWATAGALRTEFPTARVDWGAKTGTLKEAEWTGSVFLFAGGPVPRATGPCAVAGVVTIEFTRGSNPDGRATRLFRDAIAPILRSELGWGDRACRAASAPR